jgi:hypothetical protein
MKEKWSKTGLSKLILMQSGKERHIETNFKN